MSTVVAAQPYMGLVLNSTKSWSEPEYNKAVRQLKLRHRFDTILHTLCHRTRAV